MKDKDSHNTNDKQYNQVALEALLDELLPPPASGFEMPLSTVAQRALRILGYGGSSQSRKALTLEQKAKLAQFSPWEMKKFQRVCSLMSDPESQDKHHRQWMDRTLIGSDPNGSSALCWMPTEKDQLDVTQINLSRQAALRMLLTLLNPELGTASKFSKHPAFVIETYDNKTLVDIKLGHILEFYSDRLRLKIAQYKALETTCPRQAAERASRHTKEVFQNLIKDIGQRTNIPDSESDPLAVQLLKAITCNRMSYNINQLIKQTKEAGESLALLTEFLASSDFQLIASVNEASENQRLLELFDLKTSDANTLWRSLNEEQLLRIRTRAGEVWKLLKQDNLLNGYEMSNEEAARRTYSFFLTLIIAWCYCKKVTFRANLRSSKVRDLMSGEKCSTVPSIPELRFHVTQVKLFMMVELFNGSGTEALKQLVKHRLFQYDCELQLILKLQSLSIAQLERLYPEYFKLRTTY